MKRIYTFALILLLLGGTLTTLASNRNPQPTPTDAPFWAGRPDAPTFEKMMAAHLASAQQAVDQMLAAKGKRTVANTLRPYDEALTHLDAARDHSDLLQNVHPDAAYRAAAEKVSQNVSAFATAL